MPSNWLYGLVGGLEGVAKGIEIGQKRDEENVASQYRTLQLLYDQGDEKIRALAAEGLAEIAQKGPKYKGTHLQQIREYMMPAVTSAPIGGPEASAIGTPPSQTPAAGSLAPPPVSATITGGAQTPMPAFAGSAPSASLPSTSPTTQPGGAAGQRPAPPSPAAAAPPVTRTPGTPGNALAPPGAPGQAAGGAGGGAGMPGFTSPAVLGQEAAQAAKAAGISPPSEAVDMTALAAQVAKEFGLTPEQINDPQFTHPGGLASPERQRIKTQYQTRLGQAAQTASSENRAQLAAYTQSVMGYVGQVGAAERTRFSAGEAEKRAATREAERDKNTEQAAGRRQAESEAAYDRRIEAQARGARQNIIQTTESAITKATSGTGAQALMVKQQLKKDPGMFDRMRADAVERANMDYRARTGKDWAEPTPRGAKGASGGKSKTPAGAPPAAPSTPPAAAPPSAGLAVKASATPGPPPGPPVTLADDRRAEALKANMMRRGLRITDLAPADQSFIQDYVARKASQTGAPGGAPGGMGMPPAAPTYQHLR